MSLPVPFHNAAADSSLSARQLMQAQAADTSAELEVYRHFLWSRVLAEKERIDSETAAEALEAALHAELKLLRGGLAEAGQSAAGIERVARKLELLASVDDRRFLRRFGG